MRRTAVLGCLLLLVSACGFADPPRLTVFAASSLSGTFPALGQAFAATDDGTDVRFSFAGSQSLVAQVQQGAPADVLATADEAAMAQVRTARPAQVFARNRLAVVARMGLPVPELAELGRPDLKVVLAAAEVPVGRASRVLLTSAGVVVRPVSEEPDVKSVLGKVRSGEADAGIVYATDLVAAAGDVGGRPVSGPVTALPIAVLRDSERAAAFVRFVLSSEGRRILARDGFLIP